MSDLPTGFKLDKPAAQEGGVGALPAGFVLDATKPAAEFKPTGETPADAAMRGIARTVVPPVVNFLTAPVRDLSARVVGAVRGGLPLDDQSRASFNREYEKSLPFAAIPETRGGEAISQALGLPGQALGGLAKIFSENTFGKETTKAIGPYAGAAADFLPYAGAKVGAARGASTPSAMTPHPTAVDARAAGYRLPPEEISDNPGLGARLLSGLTGKYKKQQAFSEYNQTNTNTLAARAIGLPADTTLMSVAFDRARAPAIAAYDAIRNEIPDTALGSDPVFRQAVDGVGVRSAEVERAFPEVANNPRIAELRQQLLQNGVASTDAVMKKISDLRADGARNFRKRDDAQAHALGYAQRQAADVLEDAIERSIGYGPERVSAFSARDAAVQQVANAQAALSGQRVSAPGGMPAAQAALDAASKDLVAKLAAITPDEIARASTLRGNFQSARQLFAKTYDIEAATNAATGDVVARRIAGLRSGLKRPLTGELKQIADAADAFPKDMQSPSTFGHLEDWSVLDIVGGAAAAAAGHPIVAGTIAGRHPARAALRSETMQRRMFDRHPMMSSPKSGAYLGEAAMPRDDDPLARAFGH